MAQARRKSPARSGKFGGKSLKAGGHLAGIAMLLAGMAIGSLATILWQGAKTADSGVGAGIRQIAEIARSAPAGDEKNTAPQKEQAARPSTPFDFFTMLPGLEVVVPDTYVPPAAEIAAAQKPAAAKPDPTADGSQYMLQAASYQNRVDADRLKATLGLNGLVSAIQKISIQGKGDFYRVRLGPYATYKEMVGAENLLAQAGIKKSLRLKISNTPKVK